MLFPLRLILRIVSLIVATVVLYFGVTLLQVWLTSRQYDPHPAGAIMVMGAAEYNGTPTLDLQARLQEALILFNKGDAHLIMVTGSKEKGDLDTEAGASKTYLEQEGSRPPTSSRRAAPTATTTWPRRHPN